MPAEECPNAFNLRPPAGGFVLHALIFANGDLEKPSDWPARIAGVDLLINADGGAEHCRALGLIPDVLIGDLDSLTPALRAELEKQAVRLILHPSQKDQTDFELALLHAKDAGAEEITVLGGLGRRWDHSLANLFLAGASQFADLKIVYLHGDQRIYVLHGKQKLDAKKGERVSLLALAADAHGVTTNGLEYALHDETLFFGGSRGVSNMALLNSPEVAIREGVLLCVVSPFELK